MNGYYIAAIFFGAIMTFCMIRGGIIQGRKSTVEQTTIIEQNIKALGNKIQTIQDQPKTTQQTKLDEIKKEYNELAINFFKSLPIKVEQEKARNTEKTISNLEKSRSIEKHIKFLKQEAENLITAYNSTGTHAEIKLKSTKFPLNIIDPRNKEPYYTLISFSKSIHWMIRFVNYPDGTLALQFVRVIAPPGVENELQYNFTNESINLVFMNNQFSISKNQSISDGVYKHILGELTLNNKAMTEFDIFTKTLLKNIIEYEFLQQSLKE